MIIKRTSKYVGVYDKDWNLIKILPSLTEASKFTGVKVQNIWKTCTGYKTTLGGYNFKYEED